MEGTNATPVAQHEDVEVSVIFPLDIVQYIDAIEETSNWVTGYSPV